MGGRGGGKGEDGGIFLHKHLSLENVQEGFALEVAVMNLTAPAIRNKCPEKTILSQKNTPQTGKIYKHVGPRHDAPSVAFRCVEEMLWEDQAHHTLVKARL